MQQKAWHPCEDAIDPIIKGLLKLGDITQLGLPKSLEYTSSRPSWAILSDAYSGPQMAGGAASRREMLRRWLQFNGFEPDSREVSQRLGELSGRLRAWEDKAFDRHIWNRSDCEERIRKGIHVTLIEQLGEETCESLGEIADSALSTADYLRQLGAMVREKYPVKPMRSEAMTILLDSSARRALREIENDFKRLHDSARISIVTIVRESGPDPFWFVKKVIARPNRIEWQGSMSQRMAPDQAGSISHRYFAFGDAATWDSFSATAMRAWLLVSKGLHDSFSTYIYRQESNVEHWLWTLFSIGWRRSTKFALQATRLVPTADVDPIEIECARAKAVYQGWYFSEIDDVVQASIVVVEALCTRKKIEWKPDSAATPSDLSANTQLSGSSKVGVSQKDVFLAETKYPYFADMERFPGPEKYLKARNIAKRLNISCQTIYNKMSMAKKNSEQINGLSQGRLVYPDSKLHGIICISKPGVGYYFCLPEDITH